MVPVENAAGGAATVFHKPYTERTPEKYADEVADVEKHTDDHENAFGNQTCEIKYPESRGKSKPYSAYDKGIFIALFNVVY